MPSLYKVIRTRDVTFDRNSFYNPKGQDIDYLLRDALEDTIQVISLPEPLPEDESEDESILYQMTTPTTAPDSNDSTKLPTKDIEQLPTPSRTVSPDLPELSTEPQGLQDYTVNTIELIAVHHGTPEPSNASNTAPQANEISAKPSTDLILPEGSNELDVKRMQQYWQIYLHYLVTIPDSLQD